MGFNQNTGVYTPAAGALTAAAGQVVQSAVWDGIFTDMTNAFTTAVQALQATYGQRNIIGANGGMEVWQRGAGGSASISLNASTTAYTADRWYLATSANQACTVSQVAGLNAPTGTPGSRWAAKVQRNSGQTGVGTLQFGFPLDSDECAMLQNQIVALSFVAKAGANWSPASGAMTVALLTGTGSPVKNVVGYSGQAAPINSTANLTTTATRFFFISTVVPSTTTQAEVAFEWTPVGTAGVDDSFTIDDVQLEILPAELGLPNSASPVANFERWPFERMLAACKRHYRKSFPYSVAPAQNAGLPGAAVLVEQAAQASCFWIQHAPISLRATGSYTSYNPAASNANANSNSAAATLAVSLDSVGVNSPDLGMIYVTASGASAGAFVAIHWQADAGI